MCQLQTSPETTPAPSPLPSATGLDEGAGASQRQTRDGLTRHTLSDSRVAPGDDDLLAFELTHTLVLLQVGLAVLVPSFELCVFCGGVVSTSVGDGDDSRGGGNGGAGRGGAIERGSSRWWKERVDGMRMRMQSVSISCRHQTCMSTRVPLPALRLSALPRPTSSRLHALVRPRQVLFLLLRGVVWVRGDRLVFAHGRSRSG